MIRTKQLHHALVVVSDLEKARRFYGKILGLQELQRPNLDRAGLWFGIGNNELHISVSDESLSFLQKELREPFERGREGRHIAFTLEGNLDEIAKDLEAAHISHVKGSAGLPQLFCEDGNGNLVELNTGWEQKPMDKPLPVASKVKA